ncbi:MAG: hypothetical protein AN485_07500 [Anabaena sp. MDT14b]|nr:MAG: hypothetical protein AN485_07500 [Anabaena sp. MDT14b]
MQKLFTFSLKTIITRWEDSAIINCEDDEEFIRLVKNEKYIINLMLPSKNLIIISREGKRTKINGK